MGISRRQFTWLSKHMWITRTPSIEQKFPLEITDNEESIASSFQRLAMTRAMYYCGREKTLLALSNRVSQPQLCHIPGNLIKDAEYRILLSSNKREARSNVWAKDT